MRNGCWFDMHDQLRDLGRSIFCKKQSLEEISGPWDHDYKGVSRVLRLVEKKPWFHDWIRVASSGDSNSIELLSEVRWLKWEVRGSDLSLWTTNLHLPKLAVLDLSNSKITEDWEGWSSIKASKRLKVLILDRCRNLKKLPEEVGELKDLVELSAWGCSSLREIPSSIKAAKRLQVLILDCCYNLEKLPEEVGELKDLVELRASGCSSLREIPSSIGDLQNLQHLDISFSGIEKLPSAIGRLKNLRTLDLRGCEKLRSLRHLSSLIHLQELHLYACHLLEDILELPPKLLQLRVEECDKLILLKLDGLKNLEELSIEKCSSIERLDLSQLIRLKRLRVEYGNNLVEIQGLDNLEFLEDIFMCGCNSIERLLCSESRCLKRLEVGWCKNLDEIRGLDCAKFLEALDIIGCESMETLPNLMGCERLRSLSVRCCEKLTQLRGLEKLDLSLLDIRGCDLLEATPELSRTRVFRNSLSCYSCDSWSDVSSTEESFP